MYINTHTENEMIESICKIFEISRDELLEWICRVSEISADDNYYEMIDDFVNNKSVYLPDEILLFHLSRRLHGTENIVEGSNLADLLTTENCFSNFMKEYGFVFYKNENHIEVIYKRKLVNWDYCFDGNSSYMKSRLGYFKGKEDYCFNGFAFKDLLYKNSYAYQLSMMPEFLSQLIECLGCSKLGDIFTENSSYYCYEYKIPLEFVMFDAHDDYLYEQKQKYLIKCVLLRIIQYQIINRQYVCDDDNPVLRLGDDYTLPGQYFVAKEKVVLDC